MPKFDKDKVWVSVGVRFSLWTLLKARAGKDNISVQKELEIILCKEMEVKNL